MAAAILDAALLALLAVVTATDLRTRLVPDRALLAATAVAIPLAAAEDPAGLPERLAAALGAGGFLLAAALIRPGGMGLGDVKLGAVLGLYLGRAVVPALLVALLAGALAGAVLIVRRGPAARKQTIPFVPFMALGALCAVGGADWYLAPG
jgi:leader peptidase (prepilin peptidase)/N-methyltransferase